MSTIAFPRNPRGVTYHDAAGRLPAMPGREPYVAAVDENDGTVYVTTSTIFSSRLSITPTIDMALIYETADEAAEIAARYIAQCQAAADEQAACDCPGNAGWVVCTYGEASIPAHYVPVQACGDCQRYSDDEAAARAARNAGTWAHHGALVWVPADDADPADGPGANGEWCVEVTSIADAPAEVVAYLHNVGQAVAAGQPASCVVCPECGNGDFEEHALRYTTQPVAIGLDGDEDYDDNFDYGDDVRVQHVECGECGETWPSMGHLLHAAKAAGQAVDADQLAKWAPVIADHSARLGDRDLLDQVANLLPTAERTALRTLLACSSLLRKLDAVRCDGQATQHPDHEETAMPTTTTPDVLRLDRLTVAQHCDLTAAIDSYGIALGAEPGPLGGNPADVVGVTIRQKYATFPADRWATVRVALVDHKNSLRAAGCLTVACSSLLRKLDAVRP